MTRLYVTSVNPAPSDLVLRGNPTSSYPKEAWLLIFGQGREMTFKNTWDQYCSDNVILNFADSLLTEPQAVYTVQIISPPSCGTLVRRVRAF